ncbi:hypothetical protein [Geofilum rubicundum]|uniref:Assimilatory nitrate reductase large subunit n=1 Tax=Geofilum rubicundum JCM 15548 TaxID=1236989 RepID=A0A0E9M0P1_9BACT|nr:hypothetical protein [Geofilum rubicundum]GAO30710.1 assimilatory nitrate reductase large subunit [Geofilum rubicundum JCM 15548]
MTKLPVSKEDLIKKYGPHKQYTPKEGFFGAHEPDKLVKTHCCFCGMQCGIQLKVKNNSVVGFEPWMEFPFNEGRLCPKGVERYLQNNHPDRLLQPLQRLKVKALSRSNGTQPWSGRLQKLNASRKNMAMMPWPCSQAFL